MINNYSTYICYNPMMEKHIIIPVVCLLLECDGKWFGRSTLQYWILVMVASICLLDTLTQTRQPREAAVREAKRDWN